MKTHTTTVLVGGLCFPEGPRWRDDKLWFSDMHACKVHTVDLSGKLETVVEVPNRPSGLGWDPQGRLLIVSMTDRKLLRFADGRLEEHADLSGIAEHDINDMVVDAKGRAYVGNFGSEFGGDDPPKPATLARVDPDGSVHVAARELQFPNGAQITPDGRTLIIGETFGRQLSAFDIEDDGTLTNRRVWASVEGGFPDGSCLDAEGAVWVASPFAPHQVLRVHEGGEISERVEVGTDPFACMLGGPERKTLFVCTAPSATPQECIEQRGGAIEICEVAVPGAGLP